MDLTASWQFVYLCKSVLIAAALFQRAAASSAVERQGILAFNVESVQRQHDLPFVLSIIGFVIWLKYAGRKEKRLRRFCAPFSPPNCGLSSRGTIDRSPLVRHATNSRSSQSMRRICGILNRMLFPG